MSDFDDPSGYFGDDEGEGDQGDRYDDVVWLQDENGDWRSETLGDWLDLALEPKDWLLDEYTMDNLDIMYQLDAMGLIDSDDWDEWRAQYEELWG